MLWEEVLLVRWGLWILSSWDPALRSCSIYWTSSHSLPHLLISCFCLATMRSMQQKSTTLNSLFTSGDYNSRWLSAQNTLMCSDHTLVRFLCAGIYCRHRLCLLDGISTCRLGLFLFSLLCIVSYRWKIRCAYVECTLVWYHEMQNSAVHLSQ